MADFRLTFKFRDDYNGETTRTFEGDFPDQAAAATAAASFTTEYQAVTGAAIYEYELTEVFAVAASPTAGSLVFNTAAVSFIKDDGGRYTASIPAVADAVMSGNSLQEAAPAITDWWLNFAGGASSWLISDGQQVASIVGGKRQITRSGTTNLT